MHIDDDGDVSVVVGDSQHLFSPVCLDVVDPNSLSTREKVPAIPNNLHSIKCKGHLEQDLIISGTHLTETILAHLS